jgi:predicted Zn-dependent protease
MWESAENSLQTSRHAAAAMGTTRVRRVIAEQHIQGNRFASIIDEILKKESFKGRDLELFKTILQRYQWQNQNSRRQEFLEKVCAADPKNRELNFQLAELYDVRKDGARKVAILDRLVGDEPANPQYREAQANCLIELGRADEAIERTKKWVEEKRWKRAG